jgi:hypothetical protein
MKTMAGFCVCFSLGAAKIGVMQVSSTRVMQVSSTRVMRLIGAEMLLGG